MKKSMTLAMMVGFRSAGSGGISLRRFSGRRFLQYALWLLGGLLLVGSPAQAEVKAGDILVADQGRRAVFVVKPTTGRRRILSDFSNPAQGPVGADLFGVAVGATGPIYVTEVNGRLFAVDRDTGQRAIISDFHQGSIQGTPHYGLALDAAGRLVVNVNLSAPRPFAVVRVNPHNDRRVIVSDFENPAQGEVCSDGCFLTNLALQTTRRIFVSTIEECCPEALITKLVRVNTVTGQRRLVTDFSNPAQGPVGEVGFFTSGLAVEASGDILVAIDRKRDRFALLRVDPTTGQRTIVSNFNNPTQGPRAINLFGVALGASGNVIVYGAKWNPNTGTGINLLFRVNAQTGRRTVISNGNRPGQGPDFSVPVAIAVVPRP